MGTPEGAPGPNLHGSNLQVLAKYLFVAASLVGVLHFNLVLPYGLRPARGTLSTPYYALANGARRLGLANTWRMGSPVLRQTARIAWAAQNSEGDWVELDLPYLGTRRPGDFDALGWVSDTKLARIQDDFLYFAPSPHLPRLYVATLRQRIAADLAWEPRAIRARVESAPIPAPSAQGHWSPFTAEFTTHQTWTVEFED